MNIKFQHTLDRIGPLDTAAMDRVKIRLDTLTKPPGSLGRLEELAVRLAGITGSSFPVNSKKKIIIMAADHGVADENISAYPREVTRQMVYNFVRGGAAINAIAGVAKAEVRVIDIGIGQKIKHPEVTCKKVRFGTANFSREKAMSREEAEAALLAGISTAEEEKEDGVQLLATGEMGIGNTTSSSAVMAAMTQLKPAAITGRGTGISDAQLAHKTVVIEKALSLHRPDPNDPLDVLSKVGGLEIAGLAGLILGAASNRCPVILDGFISTVSALVALKITPSVKNYLLPSHLSAEPGHSLLLNYLNLKPYLHMDMRLGEGTGAALVMNLVEASARVLEEMATFKEAGVSSR